MSLCRWSKCDKFNFPLSSGLWPSLVFISSLQASTARDTGAVTGLAARLKMAICGNIDTINLVLSQHNSEIVPLLAQENWIVMIHSDNVTFSVLVVAFIPSPPSQACVVINLVTKTWCW